MERAKGGGSVALIVLGEAPASLGREQEAIRAFKTFLQHAPGSPTASDVRGLIAILELRASSPADTSERASTLAVRLMDDDSVLTRRVGFPQRPQT